MDDNEIYQEDDNNDKQMEDSMEYLSNNKMSTVNIRTINLCDFSVI